MRRVSALEMSRDKALYKITVKTVNQLTHGSFANSTVRASLFGSRQFFDSEQMLLLLRVHGRRLDRPVVTHARPT